jgi:hypothetical protein
MQHHGKAGEQRPNPITDTKGEAPAAFRGDNRAQFGPIVNADRIFRIHLAAVDACDNPMESIFGTAVRL